VLIPLFKQQKNSGKSTLFITTIKTMSISLFGLYLPTHVYGLSRHLLQDILGKFQELALKQESAIDEMALYSQERLTFLTVKSHFVNSIINYQSFSQFCIRQPQALQGQILIDMLNLGDKRCHQLCQTTMCDNFDFMVVCYPRNLCTEPLD
jgi:hypothetical protein